MSASQTRAYNAAPPAFPWDEALAFGFGVLRLPARDIWQMTPREIAYAVEGFRGKLSSPPDRASLASLMSAYPDERIAKND